MNEIIVRSNLPDVQAQLRELGFDFERRVIRSATRAAATIIKRIAVQNAPVLQHPARNRIAGALRRAIYVGRDRRAMPGTEKQYISVKTDKSKKTPFYWRFLEGGWIPRGPGKKIGGGKRLRALRRQRLMEAGAVVVSHPFLDPAFRSGQGSAISAFYDRINKRIELENAKHTKGS